MGKNSLIKSTAKKKKVKKEVIENDQGKADAKTKAPRTTAKKAVTYEGLIFKKFDTVKPEKIYAPPAGSDQKTRYTAPPFVSEDDADRVQRIKSLLFTQYNWESVKAAAEKIIPSPPFKRTEPDRDQKVGIRYMTGKTRKSIDPQTMMMKMALGLFGFIVLAIIGVSFSNYSTYTLVQTKGSVEVWQGKFAPMGQSLLLTLQGVEIPKGMNTTGSGKTIFPFVVDYFLDKADAFLESPGVLDFVGIKSRLDKAAPYAITPELKKEMNLRMTTIHLMSLIYRSDVAASEETPEGFQAGLSLLEEAKALELDVPQAELVNKKIESINARLTSAESRETESVEQTGNKSGNPSSPVETPAEVVSSPAH